MVRRVPSKQRNVIVQREPEQGALKILALLLMCGLVLAGGFVYAGGQHFGALSLGYKTEKLRKSRDELAEQQRRLLSEREAAASPGRLERAARQIGLQPMQAAQINPLKSFSGSVAPERSGDERNGSIPARTARPVSPHEKASANPRSKGPADRNRNNVTR
jgi:cell division protein FtsL